MVNRWIGVVLVLSFCWTLQTLGQPSEADRKLFKETQARANKGDAAAQLALGNLYFAGTGVSRDLKKGAKWHRKAAEQGLAEAQHQLGLDYTGGDGVKMNKAEGARWFRRAAEQNLVEAQVDFGLCCVRGDGVAANGVEGVEWFRKAAARGSGDAEYQVGKCYLEGAGVSKDIDQALMWIRHAAERGFPPAQNELGVCYEKGIGVTKDPLQAYKWFALAAARDDAHAVDIRVSLAKMEALLSKEQVAEAQRLAREFKPANTPMPGVPADPLRTGAVTVNAEDEHSEIFVDGALVGTSPAKLKLKEGPHVVVVKRAGFKDYRKEITVSAGSDLNLRVSLIKE
ncbi:MAG TPA: PEGA domain-containing protein [Verrucomicrobiae bacterium]